jgi:hypothetical protein
MQTNPTPPQAVTIALEGNDANRTALLTISLKTVSQRPTDFEPEYKIKTFRATLSRRDVEALDAICAATGKDLGEVVAQLISYYILHGGYKF